MTLRNLISSQSPQVTNPPDDWTLDETEMAVEYYWGPDGEGTAAAKDVGLADPQPLMIKSRDAGADAYVFTASGGHCYLWTIATGDVFEYVNPADLEGILAEMRKPAGRGRVEKKLLPVV